MKRVQDTIIGGIMLHRPSKEGVNQKALKFKDIESFVPGMRLK